MKPIYYIIETPLKLLPLNIEEPCSFRHEFPENSQTTWNDMKKPDNIIMSFFPREWERRCVIAQIKPTFSEGNVSGARLWKVCRMTPGFCEWLSGRKSPTMRSVDMIRVPWVEDSLSTRQKLLVGFLRKVKV